MTLELTATPQTIWTARGKPTTIADAVDWFVGATHQRDAVGLAWGPRQVGFIRVVDGRLDHPHGERFLDSAYHAELYTDVASLTWQRDQQGATRASLISDCQPSRDAEPTEVAAVISNVRHLVWGTAVAGEAPGWLRVSERRVGTLDVPFGRAVSGRLALAAKEYVSRGLHGNAVITHQRITGIVEVADD